MLSRDAPPHQTTDRLRSPALKHLVDLLRAPGWGMEMLESELSPVLSAAGLAGPGAPDLLALVDPAGPHALAPWVHAILARRLPVGLAEIPRVADASSLRALADRALELAA